MVESFMRGEKTDVNRLRRLVKKNVEALPKYQAGLPEEVVRKKYKLEYIARLASNENPFGVSSHAQKAVAEIVADLWKYSDPDASELRNALSRKIGVAADRIVVGNGSEDLICLICRACLEKKDRAVTVHPSFMLHEIYPLEQGADVVTVPMTDDLRFDVEGIVREVEKGCRLLIFSNPSNPVGAMLAEEGMEVVCRAASSDTLIVIDEAYYEYVADTAGYPNSLEILNEYGHPYVILRTFSKAYGLAGTRIGYGMFSDTWLAEQINKLRTPFNVNLVAQKAAAASLEDAAHVEKTVRYTIEERQRITLFLRSLGFTVADSYANFIFVDCQKNSPQAAEFLLENGIIVKPWAAAGFETFLRVSIGRREDNDRFVDLLASFVRVA